MDYEETGLDELNQVILKKLYPSAKKKLTLADMMYYSWDQLSGRNFNTNRARTIEQYKKYENNLAKGFVSLRE